MSEWGSNSEICAALPLTCRLHPLHSPLLCSLQSEELLFEAVAQQGGAQSPLRRCYNALASLARLAVLLLLFSPVALTAPFVGDFLGISRTRWLRLLRWAPQAGAQSIDWMHMHMMHMPVAACGRCACCATAAPSHSQPPLAHRHTHTHSLTVSRLLPPPLLLPQAHPRAGRPRLHQVGAVGGHAPRPLPSRPLL